jgi:hypothetical protein
MSIPDYPFDYLWTFIIWIFQGNYFDLQSVFIITKLMATNYIDSPLFWQSGMDNLYVSEDHDHCFDSLEWTIYMLARIMTIVHSRLSLRLSLTFIIWIFQENYFDLQSVFIITKLMATYIDSTTDKVLFVNIILVICLLTRAVRAYERGVQPLYRSGAQWAKKGPVNIFINALFHVQLNSEV